VETLSGRLLVATPHLIDPNFHRSVVLILEHGNDGALGLILNRPTTERAETYLPSWHEHLVPPGIVHFGGPVDPEVAIGLGRAGDDAQVGVSGFALVDLTADPEPDSPHVKVYAGYSGWTAGQLEDELQSGSWFVLDAAPDDPFGDPDGLWTRVLRRQGGTLSMIGLFPDDPRMN
jgi:putative transcriptional regulator